MKVITKPIEVVAWFDKIGTVHPVRFRIVQDEEITTVIIDKIINQIETRLAGIYILVFTWQSLIDGKEKLYEIKYEIFTHRWILFKKASCRKILCVYLFKWEYKNNLI